MTQITSESPEGSPFTAVIAKYIPELKYYEELYKHFHRHPEISTLETKTSARILDEIKTLQSKHSVDFDIKAPIAKTGIVAIHKNGKGPTILLRADIDGLPVKEKTGFDYASTDTQKDTDLDDIVKPTMHACGHDFHITSLLAAIDTLTAARSEWSGTILYLFQPAEERACGAQSMIDDGLYTKHGVPEPDFCLGQHVYPFRAGSVHTASGPIMSAADSFKITVYGQGGHGSMPHHCIDPVVIASSIVVRLQTLVAREIPPDETGVVTVGSLQAGQTVNIIADEATLLINIRSVTEQWRKVLIDGMKRIVNAECEAGRSPKPALIEAIDAAPMTDNDAKLTAGVEDAFTAYFGDRHVARMKPIVGSEDFSILATSIGKPYMFWFFGGHDPADWDRREKDGTLVQRPFNHSPFFGPVIQPTLKTGVEAISVAALSLVGKKK